MINRGTEPSPMPDPKWSGSTPFVGRAAFLEAALDDLRATMSGRGRALFVVGERGAGKSAGLELLHEIAARRFAGVNCGFAQCALEMTALPVWPALAHSLTLKRRLRSSAVAVAGGWLGAVPVVGDALHALWASFHAMRTRGRPHPMAQSHIAVGLPPSAVSSLLEYGALEPRLIMIDDLHCALAEDLTATAALLSRLAKTRIFLIVTIDAAAASPGRGPLHDLVLEGERLGCARQLHLQPLCAEDVSRALQEATASTVPAAVVDFVSAESGGVPGRMWASLATLETAGILVRRRRKWVWTDLPLPGAATAFGHAGLATIAQTDREVLEAAALASGGTFVCAFVAEVTGRSELDVEDDLARLARFGHVDFAGTSDWKGEPSTQFIFRDPRLRDALLGSMDPLKRQQVEQRLHKKPDSPDFC